MKEENKLMNNSPNTYKPKQSNIDKLLCYLKKTKKSKK